MWLIFAVLSMLAYAATDLLGKRKVDTGTTWTAVELLVSSSVLAFAAGLVLFACGFGESGRAPWVILAEEPIVLVSVICFCAYWFLCLLSFRYVGLSVDAAIGGMDGIVFFCGIMLVNLFFGKLDAAREMLHPARLVPILVALSCAFLLPRMETSPAARWRTVVGMLIMLLALVLDGGGDSLITAVVFDEGRVGLVDYMIASWCGTLPMIVGLSLLLRLKRGRWFVPFRGENGALGYAVLAVLSSVAYLAASSHDAVRTGIVFVAAPVFTLLAARVFLKERYTMRQNLCIWTIVIAAIAFCIADQIF